MSIFKNDAHNARSDRSMSRRSATLADTAGMLTEALVPCLKLAVLLFVLLCVLFGGGAIYRYVYGTANPPAEELARKTRRSPSALTVGPATRPSYSHSSANDADTQLGPEVDMRLSASDPGDSLSVADHAAPSDAEPPSEPQLVQAMPPHEESASNDADIAASQPPSTQPVALPNTPLDDTLDCLAALTTDPSITAAELVATCKDLSLRLRRMEQREGLNAANSKAAVDAVRKYAEARMELADYTARLPVVKQAWERKIAAAQVAVANAQQALVGVGGGGRTAAQRNAQRNLEKAQSSLQRLIDDKNRDVNGMQLRIARLPTEIETMRAEALLLLVPLLSGRCEPDLPLPARAAIVDASDAKSPSASRVRPRGKGFG